MNDLCEQINKRKVAEKTRTNATEGTHLTVTPGITVCEGGMGGDRVTETVDNREGVRRYQNLRTRNTRGTTGVRGG